MGGQPTKMTKEQWGNPARRVTAPLSEWQRGIEEETSPDLREWRRELRMSRAMELLAGHAEVERVARELGFKSPHQFAREFKEHWGYPPDEHAERVWGRAEEHSRMGKGRVR